MALGSGSKTVAITSIASSLLIDSLAINFRPSASLRQNQRPVLGHRYTVLKMSAIAPVDGDRGPFVLEHSRVRPARVHHGLNCQNHAFTKARSVAAAAVVRNLRVFMQPRANTVAHELPDDAKAVGFDKLLHRSADIPDRVSDLRCRNAALEGSLCHLQQLLYLWRYRAIHGHGYRGVTVITIQHHAAINR